MSPDEAPRRDDIVTAVAGLMAAGHVRAGPQANYLWVDYLARLGREAAGLRHYIAEAVYDHQRHTGGPGPESHRAAAEQFCDDWAFRLDVRTRDDLARRRADGRSTA